MVGKFVLGTTQDEEEVLCDSFSSLSISASLKGTYEADV